MPKRGLEITTLLLVILGLAILSSSAIVISYKNYENNYYFLFHQIFPGLLMGVLGFFIAKKIPLHLIRKSALPFLLITIILLIVVFTPQFGLDLKGAKRWVNFWGFSFQPSEILKVSFVIYLAAWLEKRRDSIKSFIGGFVPFLAITGIISLLLIAQPDIGTLGIILITALAMYFVAGSKIRYVITSFFLGASAVYILSKTAPYRLNRIVAFLNPEADPLGIGYQINQAIIAIGSGGVWGVGFGQSRQKYNYLPEPVTDSIFAIASEELGLVGATIIISLFLLFCYFGYKISKNASTEFGRLLSFGLTTWIAIQAMVNIAAISGLLPLTGVPLPFVSYGGTSLVMALTSVGIISNIAKK